MSDPVDLDYDLDEQYHQRVLTSLGHENLKFDNDERTADELFIDLMRLEVQAHTEANALAPAHVAKSPTPV